MQAPDAYAPLSTSAGSVPEIIVIKEGLFFHGHFLDTIERSCRLRSHERPGLVYEKGAFLFMLIKKRKIILKMILQT